MPPPTRTPSPRPQPAPARRLGHQHRRRRALGLEHQRASRLGADLRLLHRRLRLLARVPPTDTVGVGVFGDSDDWGVFGSGNIGVYGYGNVGVVGESAGADAGVVALAASASSVALEVLGKAKFSRSGRTSIGKGKSSLKITLAGTSTSSHVLAVLGSVQTGRYIRAVVPSRAPSRST